MTAGTTPLNCDPCYGTLAIDGVDLHTDAWCLPDLSSLWGTPDIRGADRLLPGVAGVLAFRRRATVTRHSLPMIVTGHVDRFGAPAAVAETQLQANVAYLMSFLLLPTGVGDGTRPCVWTLPSGATVTADVHVLGWPKPQLLPGAMLRTTLELSVPGGDLHL